MRLAILALAILPAVSLAQSITSTPLGAVPTSTGSKYVVSPDGGHVGIVKGAGSRMAVSIDGVDGEAFDEIIYIVQSKYAGGGTDAPIVVFSDDGKRYAYGARRGGENFVVVDGKVLPAGHDFKFSPNGARYAYIEGAYREFSSQDGGRLVVDGVASGPKMNQTHDLQFSDDGKRLMVVGYFDGGWHVIVDGKASAAFADNVWAAKMTPSGRKYGFIANQGNGNLTVFIDGVAQSTLLMDGPYGEQKLLMSENGAHFAYVSMTRGQANAMNCRVVHDGVAGTSYDRIEDLVLSQDGKRFAYVATKGVRNQARQLLVVDGKQLGYEYLNVNKPQFSADGRHVVAFAGSQAGTFVVVDGKESDPLLTGAEEFVFGATGRYFYTARMKDTQQTHVFVDGKDEGDIRDQLKGTASFSPDGTRLIYSANKTFNEGMTSLDGKSHPFAIATSWGNQSNVAAVWSPDSKHVAFMARGTEVPENVFVDLNAGSEGKFYSMATFSPDGKHVAMAGRERSGRTYKIYFDGKALADIDEPLLQLPKSWAFQPDGKLRVIAIKDKQLQRFIVDPQSSSIESFSANMGKGGKSSDTKLADKSGSGSGTKKKAGGSTVASNSASGTAVGDAKGEVQGKLDEVPDPEADAKQKVDEAGNKVTDKVNKKLDKGIKKLKGLFGDK
ncbi:MAG TPA: hypothetical protein VMF52_12100 [Steroidobacteraceae bacterium]|nr:hypothetical protein [Steroidobacteraceae bacterium]